MINKIKIITLASTKHGFFYALYIAKKFTWPILFSAFFIAFLYSSSIYAEPKDQPEIHQISISEHEFEPWTFTAHPGDIIEITNRAKISHSIYIITAAGEIINIDEKLYVQIPGTTVKWKVPASGEFTLKCWIHPSINATLVVP